MGFSATGSVSAAHTEAPPGLGGRGVWARPGLGPRPAAPSPSTAAPRRTCRRVHAACAIVRPPVLGWDARHCGAAGAGEASPSRYDAGMRYVEERDFTLRLDLRCEFPESYEGEQDGYAWLRDFHAAILPRVVQA